MILGHYTKNGFRQALEINKWFAIRKSRLLIFFFYFFIFLSGKRKMVHHLPSVKENHCLVCSLLKIVKIRIRN